MIEIDEDLELIEATEHQGVTNTSTSSVVAAWGRSIASQTGGWVATWQKLLTLVNDSRGHILALRRDRIIGGWSTRASSRHELGTQDGAA